MDPLSVFNQSPIKGTFVLHFMLITWALITTDWMPKVFIMYNLLFFLALFWSLHAAQNPEPVQLAAIINLLSILLDLMCISTNYSHGHDQGWFGFSLFLLVCNLILRAITSIVLLRIFNDRQDRFGSYQLERPYTGPGGLPFATGSVGHGGSGGTGYQDLDQESGTLPGISGGNASGTSAPYQSVPSPIHQNQHHTTGPLIDTK